MRMGLAALVLAGLLSTGASGAVWLVADNHTPDPNQEVTVYVRTDGPLYLLSLWAQAVGDANVTAVMGPADCNQYGWEPGWNIDGYYDSDGWVALGGVAWPNEANGVVGYLRLTYHSGQVAVFIAGEWSIGFDTDCQPAVFSADPLLIGLPDPNQMMQGGGPDRSIFEIKASEQTAADNGREPAEHSNLHLPPVAPAEPMSDGGAAVYTMGAMDCNEVLDPNFYPNLNDDPFVNFADAAILAANWLASGPSLAGDFDGSEQIDSYDLAYLAYFWGASACGPAPEDVFAEFKAALQSGNINEALTFIADSSRDRYAQIVITSGRAGGLECEPLKADCGGAAQGGCYPPNIVN